MKPINVFVFVLTAIFVFFIIFYLANLFLNMRSFLDLKEKERFSAELAENIFSSGLTKDRVFFDPIKLAEFGSEKHKYFNYRGELVGGKEPFVRHCRYAYHVRIEDLESKSGKRCKRNDDCRDFCTLTCGISPDKIILGSEWVAGNCDCGIDRRCSCKSSAGWVKDSESFGYETDEEAEIRNEYPIGIAYDNDIRIGKMTLEVYDTWLSRITCLIENAWNTGEIQRMVIPCLSSRGWFKKFCFLGVRRPAGEIIVDEKSECGKCGKGIGICDFKECHELGSCYFIKGTITNDCKPCGATMRCEDFNNEKECGIACGLLCRWKDGKCVKEDEKKARDYICLFDKKEKIIHDFECRYLPDIEIEEFYREYGSGRRTLKAIPLKKEFVNVKCEKAEEYMFANKKDVGKIGKICLRLGYV